MKNIAADNNGSCGNGWTGFGLAEVLNAVPASREFELEAGDTLYREGDPTESLYAVTAGLVKLISYLPDGRVRIIRLHGGDSMIGLDGLVGDQWRHTAVAVNDVKGYRIPRTTLERLRGRSFVLHDALFRWMYDHLKVADTWITEFSTGSIRARVARLVGYLARVDDSAGDEVRLLTCEEMAGVLGVTPESVSRVLAEFKRRDVLTRVGHSHHVYEVNGKVLRQLAADSV